MNCLVRNSIVFAVAVIVFAPLGARAQWSDSSPGEVAAYPYDARQPYAIEVAPGRYVIHRPAAARYRVARARKKVRAHVHYDQATIEELSRRSHVKRKAAVHKRVAEDRPPATERSPAVEEPPRLFGLFPLGPQPQIGEDSPPQAEPVAPSSKSRREHAHVERHKVRRAERKAVRHVERKERKTAHNVEPRKASESGKLGGRRTIRAEAEVTILGPDRMTIQLFRKGSATKPEAHAD